MSTITKEFQSYSVTYFSPEYAPVLGGVRLAALIACFHGTTKVGELAFHPESSNVPAPYYVNDTIGLTFPIEKFGEIHAIVRSDAALALWFNIELGCGSLMTTKNERIGLGERR